MADVNLQLQALYAARAAGILTVHHGETTTTFRNLDEINRIIKALEAQLPAEARPKRSRVSYVYQLRKGY